MNAFMGSIGVSTQEGILSPAYAVARPRREIIPDYFHYLYRTALYQQQFGRRSYGIMYERNRLYFARFKTIATLVPPLDEQRAIVAYLRAQDRRIAKLISAKQRLIKLLNEQKQTIIHRAVTRGLNPDVPLKPSGIDWLGDVPVHWDTFRLKALVNNVVEQTTEKHDDELYVALEHVEEWSGKLVVKNREGSFQSQVKQFRTGDLLFGKLRPYLAKIVRATEPGVCVGEFLVLRPVVDRSIAPFLEVILRSKKFIDLINSSTYGAKMPRAEWGFIGNVRVPFPPTLAEQIGIIDFVASETAGIDRAIQAANSEVNLIREYRDRLISDVVTGQIDVRGWQPPADESFGDEDIMQELAEAEEQEESGEDHEGDEYP